MKFDFYVRRDIQRNAILDCETNDTARLSVANIFNLPMDALRTYLSHFEFAEDQTWERLFEAILIDFNCRWGFSQTAWIHMTRCLSSNNFKRGLLPLPDVLEETWEILLKLAPSSVTASEWNEFKASLEKNSLYKYRLSKNIQYGPYGVLVGDLSFNAYVGQDHYLREAPEIVILICKEYEKQFGLPLLDEYIKITKQCQVKFKTDSSDFKDLLAALSYVYELEQPHPSIWLHNSNCYCGQGSAVLPTQILKVSFLDELAAA